MSQVQHISQIKPLLHKRAQIVRAIRQFFDVQEFTEIHAPALLTHPGQEPYLDPMTVQVKNEQGKEHMCFLHTSPEFTLKKALGAGFEKIYSLGQTFRNQESFGGIHNPEFTMLEWYRSGEDFTALMNDIEQMVMHIQASVSEVDPLPKLEVLHMREVFEQVLKIDLDEYLSIEALQKLCFELEIAFGKDDAFEDLFYRIFLEKIEPIVAGRSVIIHHYPMQMAALAKQSDKEPLYAERFEWYIDGVEIANAFSELCEADLQRERFLEDQALRKKLGRPVYPLDEEFLDAIGRIKSATGIALGVDRLVMALTGCKNIDNVLVLPLSKQ